MWPDFRYDDDISKEPECGLNKDGIRYLPNADIISYHTKTLTAHTRMPWYTSGFL